MAAITWYLTNTTSGSWRTIDESTQGAAKLTDGWIVSTGSTNHSEYQVGTERAATTFSGTTVPDGTLDTTLKDAFRTTNAYTGDFASANWTFTFSVQADTTGGAQDGRVRFRLIKAAADGSSATEITSAQQQASLVTNVDVAGTFESALTVNPGAFSVSGQYLFVQIAWERTGAGGMTSADIHFLTGTASNAGTRIVSSNFTAIVDQTVSVAGTSFGTTASLTAPSMRGDVSPSAPSTLSTTASVGAVTTVSAVNATVAVAGTDFGTTASVGSTTPKWDTNFAVTGLSATGAITAPSMQGDVSPVPTGVAATSAVGDVTITTGTSIDVSILGVEATSALGTATVQGDVAPVPAGQEVTPSVGTVTVSGTATVVLSGQEVTSSVTAPTVSATADATVALTGLEVAAAVGTSSLSADHAFTVTGVEATTALGGVSIQEGGSISVGVSGLGVTASLGALALAWDTNFDVIGQEATASVGAADIIGHVAPQISGLEITAAVGNVSVTGESATVVSVTGLESTATVGNVSISHDTTVVVTGLQGTTAVGVAIIPGGAGSRFRMHLVA
jgi:hypothetical protein